MPPDSLPQHQVVDVFRWHTQQRRTGFTLDRGHFFGLQDQAVAVLSDVVGPS